MVGHTEEEHDERPWQMLKRLNQVGLRLKKEKCEFKQTQVQYLGHVVDGQGLRSAQKKLSAIKDAPEPTNTTELQAFLGLLNYFGRFYQPIFCFTALVCYAAEEHAMEMAGQREEGISRGYKTKAARFRLPDHYDLQKLVRSSCDAQVANNQLPLHPELYPKQRRDVCRKGCLGPNI